MPVCSNCQQNESVPGQRWCRECHNAYMREHRLPYSQLSERERARSRTRAYTNVLVQRGNLHRESCGQCGAPVAQAHHPDYSNPRRVVWLCQECHRRLHGRERDDAFAALVQRHFPPTE